jgi:hypothetical protein
MIVNRACGAKPAVLFIWINYSGFKLRGHALERSIPGNPRYVPLMGNPPANR